MTPQEASAYLVHTMKTEGKVFDVQKGYLSVSPFNLRMDPMVLASAATLIADRYKDQEVQIIHGIPISGLFLATAVALQMPHVRLHTSRKDHHVPAAWKEVYRREIRSFTQSSGGVDVYSGITLSFVRKGDRVLLIDDVCARGETGYELVKGLLEKGVEVVGFAVLFDKVFQGGLERIASLGVDVFSCVRVQSIGEHDTIQLTQQ